MVDRLPRGESVAGRSRCPNCRTAIARYDNVPVVSWLILRGRCRECGEAIPARYVVLELAMAAAFAGTTLRLGVHAALPAILLVIVVHIAVMAIEWQGDVVPLPVLRVASGVVLAAFVLAAAIGDALPQLGRALAAAALAGIILWPLARASRRVTAADVELGALTGLGLAWAGPANLAIGTGVSLLVALGVAARRGAWDHRATAASCLTAGLALGVLLVGLG